MLQRCSRERLARERLYSNAYKMTKLGEGNGEEYEEVVRSPEAPVSGGGVEVMYEMPSAPPSHQRLPAIPLTETTPTGGDVCVCGQGGR